MSRALPHAEPEAPSTVAVGMAEDPAKEEREDRDRTPERPGQGRASQQRGRGTRSEALTQGRGTRKEGSRPGRGAKLRHSWVMTGSERA